MVQYGRPSRSSWANFFVVILWGDCYRKGNVRKSFCSTVGRKFLIEDAYLYTVKKGYYYLFVDAIKLAGKKQNIDPMWKVLNEVVDLGEPTSVFDHFPGKFSKTMWNKQRYCWKVQKHFWTTNVRGWNCITTMLGKSSYFFVVLW